MKLIRFSIVYVLLVYSFNAVCEERDYKGGWTSIMHEDFVDYCVESAVDKNMKYLVSKNVFKVGSDYYLNTFNKIKNHQSLVCECTHNKIMDAYYYDDITKMMKEKAFFIKFAESCSVKILSRKNDKLKVSTVSSMN